MKEGHDFEELYHWHMHKPLSDDYDRTRDNEGKWIPPVPYYCHTLSFAIFMSPSFYSFPCRS